MAGIHADTDEDPHVAWAKYKPDVTMVIMWPQLSTMNAIMYELNYSKALALLGIERLFDISRAIDSIQLDSILYRKGVVAKNAFSFLHVFGWKFWLTFLSIAIFSCFLISKKNLQKFYHNLLDVFWSIFITRHIARRRLHFLLLLWIFVTWVIRQYFCGDMVSQMATEAPPHTLDSWDDLCLERSLSIWAFDVNLVAHKEGVIKDTVEYFNRNSDYYDCFRYRTHFLTLAEYSSYGFEKMLLRIHFQNPKGDSTFPVAVLGAKDILYYRMNHFLGGLEWVLEKTHISKSGGGVQPYFLLHSHLTKVKCPKKIETLNFV